jgi:predicted ATPase
VRLDFGALSVHEDDTRRAVKTALELRKKSNLQLQMGITQGVMRVGAYGGVTRKTFGALSDDVNLAARLMTTATNGEILLSGQAHKAVQDDFAFEPRVPLVMKGKAEPLPVFALTGERNQRAIRLQEPTYILPMVGREQELRIINDKLDLTLEGKGQVIGIIAEAGLGKSRLVAEVIRSARRKGFVGYGGACQSDAINTPYQGWKSIWQAFFDVDPEQPLNKQMRLLEGEIADRAPSRVDAMPLLNVVLNLNIPENDFTKNLEPKIRQSALHALLEECLKAADVRALHATPLLFVIEDVHWIDTLSHDLLEGLAKALTNYRVCFLLAYRPPQLMRLEAPRLEALSQFTRIELHELTKAEAEQAIRAKLAQLYPYRSTLGGTLPSGLVETLMARTQGNPFYLEELLNYVRDRGLDPTDLSHIELPDSLHTLILSRIDQLSEQEKTTLRVASIVGRLFHAQWLIGYYPELGTFPELKAALDELDALDITPLDSEPELTYIFKHILTHEVTYESLPFATRTKLHEQLARYLESAYAESMPLEALAFHYGRSENSAKQREYLRKAGEAAQKNFAHDAALDYYGKLLPLLKNVSEHEKEQTEIQLKRGAVFELMGKYDEAESDYRGALEIGKNDAVMKVGAQFALGKLNRQRGDYESALDWLAQAKQAYVDLEDIAGLAQTLIEMGMVLSRQGEYTQAREICDEGLLLAREVGDTLGAALALNNLGNVAWAQGDYAAAQAFHEESLRLRREMNNKAGIAASLGNLGNVAYYHQADYAVVQAFYEESLSLLREMGDKWGIASVLGNLGSLSVAQGDYDAARVLQEESLSLRREMGDRSGIATSLGNLGSAAMAQGDYTAARAFNEESLILCKEMGDKSSIAIALTNLGTVAFLQDDYHAARAFQEECLALCQEMDEKTFMAYALLGLGLIELAENEPKAGKHIFHSLRLRQETGEQYQQISSLVGIAGLALYEGDVARAAQLLGAVASALETLNVVMEPEMKHMYMQTLAAVKAQLGEAAFQFAWEGGSRWSLEEAVERALS